MTHVSEPMGDPTRDRLLAAAAEVFAEKGYDRAGVQEIARRAGFTTGAIYGRFRGKADLLLAAIAAPLDRVMVETDAPYLAPIPHRGKRNEPYYVVKTLELLAELRGMPFEAAAAATTANARRVFSLVDAQTR